MRRGLLLFVFVPLFSCQAPSGAQPVPLNFPNSQPATPSLPPITLFEHANQLYDEGKFVEAAEMYQKALASGRASGALWFNLGNAWFKAGQLGRAINAYRRAEQLNPRDPDLQANLRFARSKVQGPTLTVGFAQRAVDKLNLNEWTWAVAGALWLVFGLLTLGQLLPHLKRSLRYYLLAGILLTALFGAGFGAALVQQRANPVAVVVSRDAVVRQGPLDEAKSVFTAHDGAEMHVLDQKDAWLQVTTDTAHLGWVRRDQVLAGDVAHRSG